jgi:hypothetical protein
MQHSKSVDDWNSFQISKVLICDLLECLIDIPLHVFSLYTGLELDQNSSTLPFMKKTKVGVAVTNSSFDGDFQAICSKGLHKAKKETVIDVLRSVAMVATSVPAS